MWLEDAAGMGLLARSSVDCGSDWSPGAGSEPELPPSPRVWGCEANSLVMWWGAIWCGVVCWDVV